VNNSNVFEIITSSKIWDLRIDEILDTGVDILVCVSVYVSFVIASSTADNVGCQNDRPYVMGLKAVQRTKRGQMF